MPIQSITGGVGNALRAYQELARKNELERARKIGNIQAGVRGGVDAFRTGQIQDDIAALQQAQTELMRPYSGGSGGMAPDAMVDPMTGAQTGSYNDPNVGAAPESALSKLGTGGWLGRFYGGLAGPDAYMKQMSPQIQMAMGQDTERLNRMAMDARQQQRMELSAYENLQRLKRDKAKRDAGTAAAKAKAQADAEATDAMGELSAAVIRGELTPDQAVEQGLSPLEAQRADGLRVGRAKEVASTAEAEGERRLENERKRLLFSDADYDPITGEQTSSRLDPYRYSTPDEFESKAATSSVPTDDLRTLQGMLPTPEPSLADRLAEREAMSAAAARGTASVRPPTPPKDPTMLIRQANEARDYYIKLMQPRGMGSPPVNPQEIERARKDYLVTASSANLAAQDGGSALPYPSLMAEMDDADRAYVRRMLGE